MSLGERRRRGVMIDTSSNLTIIGKACLYAFAGELAQRMESNSLAIEYLKKGNEYAYQAVKENPTAQAKNFLIGTLADLGVVFFKENDFTNSFDSYNAAITNYESKKFSTDLLIDKTKLLSIYSTAVLAAFRSGKTNEALAFGNKANENLGKINNSKNAP